MEALVARHGGAQLSKDSMKKLLQESNGRLDEVIEEAIYLTSGMDYDPTEEFLQPSSGGVAGAYMQAVNQAKLPLRIQLCELMQEMGEYRKTLNHYGDMIIRMRDGEEM